jgi:hypothetical protein
VNAEKCERGDTMKVSSIEKIATAPYLPKEDAPDQYVQKDQKWK